MTNIMMARKKVLDSTALSHKQLIWKHQSMMRSKKITIKCHFSVAMYQMPPTTTYC